MLLRLNKTCSLTHIFTVQVCKRYNQHLTLMFRQASQLSLGCIFLWCLGDALIHSLTTRSLLNAGFLSWSSIKVLVYTQPDTSTAFHLACGHVSNNIKPRSPSLAC